MGISEGKKISGNRFIYFCRVSIFVIVQIITFLSMNLKASGTTCFKTQKNSIGPRFDGNKTQFRNIKLENLDLTNSTFFLANFFNVSVRGIYGSQFSFKQSRLVHLSLEQSTIAYVDFRGIMGLNFNIKNVTFSKVNFSGAKIIKSHWKEFKIINSDFNSAYIADSVFENCSYSKDLFKGVILINVRFINCHEII
ncbi:MAG: hypothetical protein K1X29_07345 [Bdellovibrionales bacterium]|nr:hypothetical protein [Bdellovibrionales bacterium]